MIHINVGSKLKVGGGGGTKPAKKNFGHQKKSQKRFSVTLNRNHESHTPQVYYTVHTHTHTRTRTRTRTHTHNINRDTPVKLFTEILVCLA